MHPENRTDIVNNTCLNDFQSTARAFFSWLEDNTDGSLNIRFPLFQQTGRPQYRSRMEIMATSVHAPGML